MSKMKFYLILLIAIAINKVEMANILALFPLPMYSHTSNFMPIFKQLAARGHNVTVVSPFPQKKPVSNLTDINVEVDPAFLASMSLPDMTTVSDRLFQLITIWKIGIMMTEVLLNNKVILELIKDKHSKFDLIMTETFMFHEPLVAFGYKYNAPVINLHPSILPASAAYYTGNQVQMSYAPTRFSKFSDHMTFLERVETTFFHTWDMLLNRLYMINIQDSLMRKYLEHPEMPNLPPLAEMLKNTSLTLINHNSAFGYPFPVHKNIIEFGGINIKYSDQNIPEDLQQIMDNATEGVIYFSFGSFFNISALPRITQTFILEALGRLKQKVLIKWEKPSTISKDSLSNVEFRTWFPQSNILAHPNCKLFITHGGIHSVMEGVYHAVPLLVIPLFADQRYNAKFVDFNRLGKTLRFRKITEEKLLNNIYAVLHNPMYKENIQERSAIFKDTPVNTLDHVIYWIEYVIRHKGAPHLRPAAVDLYWFQNLMLDVVASYLFILISIIYIIKIISSFFVKFLKLLIFGVNCSSKKVKKSKKE